MTARTLGEPCGVPGCGGALSINTDGTGRTKVWCTTCEQRIAQLRLLRSAKIIVRELPREVVFRTLPVATNEQEAFEGLVRERLATPAELCREFGISHTLINHALRRRRVRWVQIGRQVLIWRESAERWRDSVRKYRRRAVAS